MEERPKCPEVLGFKQVNLGRINVLFGKEIHKAFFEDVVEACALNQDINIWLGGDSSLVGENA